MAKRSAASQNVNSVVIGHTRARQLPMIVRLVWFLFFGWYLALAWIAVALCFAVTIIGLPVAVWMLNRTNAVMTLQVS